MREKNILRIVAVLVLLYPAFSLFTATEAIGVEEVGEAGEKVNSYQLSLWISWIVLVSIAVFHKWTRQQNFFFHYTYAFILVGFGIFGYLSQSLHLAYELPGRFTDDYTFGVLTALQGIITAVVLTIFLQAGVWWFTRRWHRR
ncbi:MAG: hypothetical protein WBL27_07770 [Salinimicrobium sp.]